RKNEMQQAITQDHGRNHSKDHGKDYGKDHGKAAIVNITSLNLKHNHPLNPMTNSYATKNRTLPEAIIREISFYTTQENLSAIIQHRLL
ncbi:3431_t:CDS:2, partial [Racocetra fulgida]